MRRDLLHGGGALLLHPVGNTRLPAHRAGICSRHHPGRPSCSTCAGFACPPRHAFVSCSFNCLLQARHELWRNCSRVRVTRNPREWPELALSHAPPTHPSMAFSKFILVANNQCVQINCFFSMQRSFKHGKGCAVVQHLTWAGFMCGAAHQLQGLTPLRCAA